jgi:hypothetical protein
MVIYKLKFSGEIKIQKGAETPIFLEQFPKDEQSPLPPSLNRLVQTDQNRLCL